MLRKQRAKGFDQVSLFTGFIVLMGVVMLARLFQKSVVMHSYYLATAQQQQLTTEEIQAQRGIIYAADTEKGEPVILAESVQRYAVSATPRYITNPDQIIPALAKHLELPADDLWQKLTFEGSADWPVGKGYYTPPFKHGLTQEQVEALAKDINDQITVNFDSAQGDVIYFTEGLFFIKEFQRVYPENSLAAQVLGYVNYEGKGQYGFEQYKSRDLQGSSGNVAVERDSRGRLLAQIGEVSGRQGYSYVLTIDRNIQYTAEQILDRYIKSTQSDSGNFIVLNGRTGAVLAMSARPTYDPNKFSEVDKSNLSVFINPVISNRYEFGSVMKPLIMAMAIDAGVASADEVGSYEGSIQVGPHTISNVNKKAYPNITMTQVLEYSVNTAMVPLATRIGTDRMYDYLQKLKFGQPTGIELAGEQTGFLMPRDKMKDIHRSTISFGQGIDTTTIQMAAAYTALANNGVMLQPYIIDTVISPDGTRNKINPKEVGQVFSAQTAETLRNMMVSVVVSGHARNAAVRGYKIGGKTGTAQMARPEGGYYEDRYRHSFIAIAPSDNPEFVVFFTLENPKSAPFAESTAAPATGELLKYLLHYYQIPPTNI